MKTVLLGILRLLVAAVCIIAGAYLLGSYGGALLFDLRQSDSPVDKMQVLIHLGLALLGGFLLSIGATNLTRNVNPRGGYISGGYINQEPPLRSGGMWGLYNLLYFRQMVDKQPLVDEAPDYPQGMQTTIKND